MLAVLTVGSYPTTVFHFVLDSFCAKLSWLVGHIESRSIKETSVSMLAAHQRDTANAVNKTCGNGWRLNNSPQLSVIVSELPNPTHMLTLKHTIVLPTSRPSSRR